MAKFCEALADTGLVVDACLAAGKSSVGAYALRRRNPIFAAAWEAALTTSRERLSDTLLARSIEGSVEQYYKEGVLVGEKRVIDNRLGLAILRRLDRLAETGTPFSTRGESRFASRASPRLAPAMDWDLALAAMRSGDPDALAKALAMLRAQDGKAAEVDELNDPPYSFVEDEEEEEEWDPDGPDRCWSQTEDGETLWMTGFPPPDGFTGYQRGRWGEENYRRACSPEERALLNQSAEAQIAGYRAEDAAIRDAWFARLAAQLAERARDQAAGDEGVGAADGGR